MAAILARTSIISDAIKDEQRIRLLGVLHYFQADKEGVGSYGTVSSTFTHL